MAEIIDNNPGRTKQLVATAITALDNFDNAMIGLAWNVSHRNGFVSMGIKGLTNE